MCLRAVETSRSRQVSAITTASSASQSTCAAGSARDRHRVGGPTTVVVGVLRKKNGSPSGSGARAHLLGVVEVVRAGAEHLARVGQRGGQPSLGYHGQRGDIDGVQQWHPACQSAHHAMTVCRRAPRGKPHQAGRLDPSRTQRSRGAELASDQV